MARVYVSSYTKADGTKVKGYYKTIKSVGRKNQMEVNILRENKPFMDLYGDSITSAFKKRKKR
jgi:hypothetical protein